MIQFPSAEAELAGLAGVLADPAGAAEIRARAERLALKLSNPVRVAILGLPGAGKTELAGFLVGERLTVPGNADGIRPPLIFSHSETAAARAGWWNGKEVAVDPEDLDAAFRESPDFVELKLPNPILKLINFIDMPGVAGGERLAEQVRWTAARAEILIWCTHAAWAWSTEEVHLWSLVPQRVQRSSLLAVTHTDEPLAVIAIGETLARLRTAALPRFRDLVTIATTSAVAAAPSGNVQDIRAWEASGGRALVGRLLAAARAVREADIEAARALLAEVAPPLVDEPEAAAPEPAPVSRTEAPEARAPEAGRPASPEPAPSDDLARRLDGLIALASEDGGLRSGVFLTSAAQLAETLSASLSAPGALAEEGRWIVWEVEKASAELGRLEDEGGDAACREAAGILLQLSRDMGWAVRPQGEG